MSYILYLKPMGVLAPLDEHLILPDATDEKKWVGGKLPIFDQDRTILAPIQAYFSYILINRDLVKEGEITSYADLLKPNWRGKMVMFDPTAGPSPTQTFVCYVIPRMMGPEEGRKYLTALTKQDLVFTKDHRQLVEWVAKEKYPVAIGATPSIVVGFVRAGAPISFVRPKEGGLLAFGSSLISIIKDSPHPNTADVFINWILTDEGQEVFAANQAYPPRRLGVPYKGPDPFPVLLPGDKTFESDEAFYIEGQKTLGWAQEIFGPVVK
jgi:ABC-type Fe3+ transport system substrate-binding protein